MIGRWHKVIPSTIRRTKFIPKSLNEELAQESEFNQNILNVDKKMPFQVLLTLILMDIFKNKMI